jgi:hypothetical protein
MSSTFTPSFRTFLGGIRAAQILLWVGAIAVPAYGAAPGGSQVPSNATHVLHRQVLTIGLGPEGQCPTKSLSSGPALQSARPPQQQAPAYTWAQIVEGVEKATKRLNAAGYEVTNCSVGGSTAEREARKALQSGTYDVVVVGAGIRLNQEHLLLFEKVLNAVRELQPRAKIALHTTPEDFADAVSRVDALR